MFQRTGLLQQLARYGENTEFGKGAAGLFYTGGHCCAVCLTRRISIRLASTR